MLDDCFLGREGMVRDRNCLSVGGSKIRSRLFCDSSSKPLLQKLAQRKHDQSKN